MLLNAVPPRVMYHLTNTVADGADSFTDS